MIVPQRKKMLSSIDICLNTTTPTNTVTVCDFIQLAASFSHLSWIQAESRLTLAGRGTERKSYFFVCMLRLVVVIVWRRICLLIPNIGNNSSASFFFSFECRSFSLLADVCGFSIHFGRKEQKSRNSVTNIRFCRLYRRYLIYEFQIDFVSSHVVLGPSGWTGLFSRARPFHILFIW